MNTKGERGECIDGEILVWFGRGGGGLVAGGRKAKQTL